MMSVFGETPFLKSVLSSFGAILKSDQVSSLVKFAEAIHIMGAKVFQCIPHLICALHPQRYSSLPRSCSCGSYPTRTDPSFPFHSFSYWFSPLLRPLVGFLSRYCLLISSDLASHLFRTQTIVKMVRALPNLPASSGFIPRSSDSVLVKS
jgi:hypothetical protein